MASARPAAPPPPRVYALPRELVVGEGVCNSGDALAGGVPPGGKLLWFFRHGESTGNVARQEAMALDRRDGGTAHEEEYKASSRYLDAPLTTRGWSQARGAAEQVASWRVKPTLVVCSALTRAIQTAALVFERELLEGSARLVVRPELREFYPDNNENQGRPLAELRLCPLLRALPAWPAVSAALADGATAAWREPWDSSWARGNAWQGHCGGQERLAAFAEWLGGTKDERVALVSHWGAINGLLNAEPWADGLPRQRLPCGDLAKRFQMPNCGWVAVVASPGRGEEADQAKWMPGRPQ